MRGSLGVVISISVGTTILVVIIVALLVKCFLNWKRQHWKHKKKTRSVDGTVRQLVMPSRTVDFFLLPIQDQLVEEDGEDENANNFYISGGRSAEDLNQSRDSADSKEHKFPSPLKRLDTVSSILDKYDRKLKKPMETGTRGESLYFGDSDSDKSTPKKTISFSDSAFPKRSYTVHGRSGMGSSDVTIGRVRSASTRSLSCESLTDEGPDHIPHMRSSVVSTVDTKAPRSRMDKPRKTSTSEKSPLDKPTRKRSRVAESRGKVDFKVNYAREKHVLEVHLINATSLPIKHGNLLNSFARLSLKTPSKHQKRESKVMKKTCNPIFDEKFVFDGIYFSELQKAHLKLKIMNRVGVSRCELIGEAVVVLCDEDIMRGDAVSRNLFEKAGKIQCTGELLVSICHQATSSHLKVVVMRLKDLPKSIKSVSVTVELTHKNEILQQHHVKTKKKSLSINEELDFEVATNTSFPLENFGVQFTVYHHDFMRANEIIGQVRLAMDAPLQEEMKHWAAVVVSPHKPIAEWHKLHAPLLSK